MLTRPLPGPKHFVQHGYEFTAKLPSRTHVRGICIRWLPPQSDPDEFTHFLAWVIPAHCDDFNDAHAYQQRIRIDWVVGVSRRRYALHNGRWHRE